MFAISCPGAIVEQRLAVLFATPFLTLISWIVSAPVGWVLGGQIGPRARNVFKSSRSEVLGGVLGGLTPVLLLALLGWHLAK